MTKQIYLIRHAQSEANVAFDLDSPKNYYDARITSLGKGQALNAKQKLKNIDFDLLVCSPLTRTLQTFSLIFPKPIDNTIILPLARECLEHSCDVGRQPNILKKEFPHLNFINLEKFWWNNNIKIGEKTIKKETTYDLNLRVSKFISWIEKRKEKKIAVVSHGTFIMSIINRFLDNCEFEIWYLNNDK